MSAKPLLHQLVESLQCLPGVGKKSAQRMAYQLLERNRNGALRLADVLQESMRSIGNCEMCRDYTETRLCTICSNEKRDAQMLCIVESPADIAAIESTAGYSGRYFVLMGNLSPLDGIGPDEIGLTSLARLVSEQQCQEVIIATSATVEGEATAHYIKAMLTNIDRVEGSEPIRVTRLAQGVPIGGELGYIDQSTLSLSLANRQDI
ncbi:recombination mediator RecR [Aliikangiella coralliicola]|uniref:Recombination protein RecR n=1 Tax=Aliikangiella coralliicola TaxID=2592383 RepID=A0A545UD30_9GAMM|nr:recombination mediator RecR [Aliikangiella coralliicola]TQV87374.1 recombination protein RecR [Aliikangiella coralliicola]